MITGSVNRHLQLGQHGGIARVSAPGIFVADMLAIARRLYEEANGRRQAE